MQDKPNILLVDDKPANLLSLEALLTHCGANLLKASSGRQALEMAMDSDLALILLDVQMPEMDGFEVAELLRGTKKTHLVPIIFVTAISKDQPFVYRGYDIGAVDYLIKPIEPVILVSKVRVFLDLDLQKRQLQRVGSELRRLGAAVQQSGEGICIVDVDGRIQFANPAWAEMHGYTTAENLRDQNVNIFHAEELSGRNVLPFNSRVLQNGVYQDEVNQRRKDGSIFPALLTITALKDEYGTVVGVVSVCRDITERKRSEEALQERERLTGERVKELNCLYELSRIIETTSISLEDIFRQSVIIIPSGWQYPEIACARILYRDQEYVTENYQETEWRLLQTLRVTGSPKGSLEVCYLEERPEADEGPFLKEERDLIRGLTESLQRVIERKTAEAKLRESEHNYRSLITNIPDVVWTANGDGHTIFISDNIKTVYGYTPEEFYQSGTHLWWGRIHPDDIDQVKEAWEALLNDRIPFDIEYQIQRKDGQWIWLHDRALRAYVWQGEMRVDGVFSDITETKRLKELESRAARLDTAGTIAGQVAHDFNNLLAPMLAYPDFIREELPGNHPSLKYVDQIEVAAQKIADINQQLLTLGRRGHYSHEPLDLNRIISQAVNEMVPLTEDVTFETDLDPDLMSILGGGSQIHRVITNLLCNAVDALQDIRHINIRTKNYYADDVSGIYSRIPKGEYVKLTVADTGCGMSDDIVQKILDPFFSTKTTDQKRGSGLGMSIVDAVVKDHNGYLDLDTMPGKGTSFYIYFPTTRKSPDEDRSDEVLGGSETILIVDDDDVQRDISTQLLEKLGYDIESVESGELAIEFLKEHPRDLLILDMVMPPGIDGTETYRRILEFCPIQKVIIVSGFSETDRVGEAQALGSGAFVKKPLTKKVIAAAVRTELDRAMEVIIS